MRLLATSSLALLAGLAGCNGSNTAPTSNVIATCTANPASGAAPLAVVFTLDLGASSFFDVSFNYGDGTRSVEGFFTSSPSLSLPHVYEAPGAYTATFAASGADGRSGACSVAVEVTRSLAAAAAP